MGLELSEAPRLEIWVRALRRLGVDLRDDESAAVAALFFYSFFLGVFQFAAKAVRQATYIDSLGAQTLPLVYLGVAVLAYPVLRLYARASERLRRGTLVIGTCLLSTATLIVFWWLFGEGWAWVSVAFYLWISIATVLMLSQFWSYTNTVLHPRQARRLFGLIGSGALLGGVLGGQLTRLASGDARGALLAAAVVLLAIVAIVRVARRWHPEPSALPLEAEAMTPRLGGMAVIRSSPHLRLIAGVMFITVIVAQIIDLQFNWVVQQQTENLEERTALFGNLFSGMGLVAFVFQLLATGRIHRSRGVGFAMRVLPTFVVLLSAGVLFAQFLMPALLVVVVAALKIGDNGLRYSLDHATRELLFVPVPLRIRANAKAYIDVLVHRFAKGAAAILLLGVTLGWVTPIDMAWLALLLCLIWTVCTFKAGRNYVQSYVKA